MIPKQTADLLRKITWAKLYQEIKIGIPALFFAFMQIARREIAFAYAGLQILYLLLPRFKTKAQQMIVHYSSISIGTLPVAIIVTFACQLTDVKYMDIKVGEMIGLCLLPSLFIQKLSKNMFFMLFFFCFIFISGLCKSAFMDFVIPSGVGALKQPYWIGLTRFVELLTCFSVVAFIVKHIQTPKQLNEFIHYFLLSNSIFAIVFILSYPVGKEIGFYYFDIHRLKGFFNEGGPLGTYFAFLFMLSHALSPKKTKIWFLLLFASIMFLAQSKASAIAVLAYFSIISISAIKSRLRKFVAIIALSIVFVFAALSIVDNYVEMFRELDITLRNGSEDPNIVAGRVSGVFISNNMMADNPIFGIGLGNYPLLRNNPAYLGQFPALDVWDITGLGAIHTLLLECGIAGFILLIYCLYRLRRDTPEKAHFLLIFCMPLFFGAHLHFHYPWIMVAIMQVMQKKSAKMLK